MQEPKWAKDLMDLFLKATKYSGTRQPCEKIISASSLGKEPYYLMMEYLYGKTDEQTEYGANTTGSIYQLGIDAVIEKFGKPGRYLVAHRMKHTLENGWTISGEVDIYDSVENVIIDDKLLAGKGFEDFVKNVETHDYNMQLATYKYLFLKTKNIQNVGTAAHAVNKAGSAIKNNSYKNFDLVTVEPEKIEQIATELTDKLQWYIDNDMLPNGEDECNVFKYGKTEGVPNRCRLYCDYNKVCPAYNKNSFTNTNKILAGLEPDANIGKIKYEAGKDFDF